MATDNKPKVSVNGFEAEILIRYLIDGAGNKGFRIASRNFIHLIRDTQYAQVGKPCIGVSLPTAELKVALDSPDRAVTLLKAEATRINITEAQTFKKGDSITQLTSIYDVTNFDIDMKGNGVTVTFYMILAQDSLMNKAEIKAYGTKDEPVTSIKAIYQALEKSGITPEVDSNADADAQVNESFDTDDKQVWIQPKTTALQFIANTIKHCNPNDNDLILSAITTDTKLRLISYNGSMKKAKNKADAYIYLVKPKNDSNLNTNAVSLIASHINLESSMGVYSYLTGVESIPQVKITSNKKNVLTKALEFVFPTKKDDPKDTATPFISTERIVAPLIDCGNTHEHYWEAQLANERKLAKIYRNIVYVTVDGVALDNSLRVLDTAYVNFKGVKQDSADNNAFLEGNFIVLGISRYVSQSQVSNRIALGRASYS